MKQEEIYTSLEDSKLVAPILQRAGIEADAWWACNNKNAPESKLYFSGSNQQNLCNADGHCSRCLTMESAWEVLPAWELKKLLIALPVIIAESNIKRRTQSEALHACCELLVLLEKERLLEKS